MNVEIIGIGSLKESYLREAEREYLKRLSAYLKISVTEIREARLPQNAGSAEEEGVRTREGEALLEAAGKHKNAFVFALDMRGRGPTSEGFAKQIEELSLAGHSTLVFIIGGSLGLSGEVRKRAGAVISFSAMTFPHQLMRIILLEQIYRAQKILRNEPYHK